MLGCCSETCSYLPEQRKKELRRVLVVDYKRKATRGGRLWISGHRSLPGTFDPRISAETGTMEEMLCTDHSLEPRHCLFCRPPAEPWKDAVVGTSSRSGPPRDDAWSRRLEGERISGSVLLDFNSEQSLHQHSSCPVLVIVGAALACRPWSRPDGYLRSPMCHVCEVHVG